jgi:hypothetical protein
LIANYVKFTSVAGTAGAFIVLAVAGVPLRRRGLHRSCQVAFFPGGFRNDDY